MAVPMYASVLHQANSSLDADHMPIVQLAAAQQYSMFTSGYPPLHRWAKAHMLSMHAPPAGVHDMIMTNGNNQTIEVTIAEP
jgi:DNA-binding transcriptional MocR family regulator